VQAVLIASENLGELVHLTGNQTQLTHVLRRHKIALEQVGSASATVHSNASCFPASRSIRN
jgi:hypothetical protein